MRLIRVDKFKIHYNSLQHAFFTTIAKRYVFCLNLLAEWLYFFIDKKDEEWFKLLRYQIQRNKFDIIKAFPSKLYMYYKKQLPSYIAQNIFDEALALAKSRKAQTDMYHSSISYFGFTWTAVPKSKVVKFPRSKYLKQHFPTVFLTIPDKVFQNVTSQTNQYYFMFRFVNGQWWCYIIKKLQLSTNKDKQNRCFAAIDLNMTDIAFIDEVTKQPILLSLKHVIWKALKLFKKYQKAQSVTDNRKAKIYRSRIKHIFAETFKLYAVRIIQYCKIHKINRIAIGSVRPYMTQKELSRPVRRLWNMIPWSYFFDYLYHYGQKFGIYVYKINEAYTSKASALDNDPLPETKNSSITFSGKRISRGLYKAKDGTVIHADINAAANILRRAMMRFNKTIQFTKHQLSAVRRVGLQLLSHMKLDVAIKYKKLKDYIASPGKFFQKLVRLAKSSYCVTAFLKFMFV